MTRVVKSKTEKSKSSDYFIVTNKDSEKKKRGWHILKELCKNELHPITSQE
jgi:hypothetical protein